jgi:hypothetical protein
MIVSGSTDSTGSAATNLHLSQRRARPDKPSGGSQKVLAGKIAAMNEHILPAAGREFAEIGTGLNSSQYCHCLLVICLAPGVFLRQ